MARDFDHDLRNHGLATVLRRRVSTKRQSASLLILNLAVILIAFQNCSEMSPSEALVEETAIYEQERSITSSLQNDDSLLFWKNPNSTSSLSQVLRRQTQWSAVFYLRPGGNDMLLSITPGEDYEFFELRRVGASLVLKYVNDSEASYSYTLPLSNTEPHVVGFSFGPTPDMQMFYVDGRYKKLTRVDVGDPRDVMSLDRDMTVSNQLEEFIMFSRALTGIETNSLSRSMGRAWGMGELPFDIGPDVPKVETYTPSLRFLAAKQVIATRCLECHGDWSGYNNENQFVRNLASGSKLVKPGDLAASELYHRVTLASGDAKRMPEAPSAELTSAEKAVLADWIQHFGEPDPASTPTPTPGPSATPTPSMSPTPTPTPVDPAVLRFQQAKLVLMRQSCFSCHSAWAGQNEAFFKATLTTQTTYPPDGMGGIMVGATPLFVPGAALVVPGNPDVSAIIQRVQSNVPVGPRMPKNLPAISTADLATLRNWIQNMP